MTHDEMAPSRRVKKTGEIGGVIMGWVEGRKSRKSVVGGEPLRGGLPCKASSEPGNPQSFCQLHAAPQNAPRTIGAIAQPDLARKYFFFEAREQRGAYLRQNLDMLMPIHKSWRSVEMLAKTVELARDFP